jgi:putative ribosome biogenesis GTPase RsgA
LEDLDGIVMLECKDAQETVSFVENIESGENKVICLLGTTGVGKSSLGNTLTCKRGTFKTSPDLKSETDETKGVVTSIQY